MQFSQLPGHTVLKQKLTKSVRDGKIAHAQLFLGNDGYGTLPMAIAYAQYLFCENRGETDSCGQCSSCQRVNSYNHPDLHFSFPFRKVKGKETSTTYLTEWREQLADTTYFDIPIWGERSAVGNSQPLIPVTEAEHIAGKLMLKSFEGGYKVMIMWHSEQMNVATANALLKLIEEPPPKTVFLLLSDNYDAILKTIASRTQLVKVNRITHEEMKAYLMARGTEEGIVNNITNLSEGDYITAQRLLHQSEETNFFFEEFQKWMRFCYQRKVIESFDWSEAMAKIGREKQKQFLTFCLHMFRQSILGNYSNMQMMKVEGPEKAFLTKFAQFINHKNILELNEEFSQAHYYIERNANAKILFTDLSIKVIRLLRA